MSKVRDAMVPEPGALEASASAQEAGEHLSDPAVRAVLVCDDDGKLVGVVTRKTLVKEIVATGRDPRASLDLDEAFRALEENDLERVPVVEHGRLLGIVSRAVLQRRLAEDEPPADVETGRL